MTGRGPLRGLGVRRLFRAIVGRPARPRYVPQFLEGMDLDPFEGQPRLYLIASTPRSGSHFLGHALRECRAFGVPLEYLHPGHMASLRSARNIPDDIALFRALIRDRTSQTGWFGLKAHWSQFEPHIGGPLLAVLGEIDRALWIYRRDLLAQGISYLIAEQTGQWVASAPKRAEPVYSYDGIVRKATDVREQNLAWRQFFEGFSQPLLRVVYEDLVADEAAGLGQVVTFLEPETRSAPRPPERIHRQSSATNKEWRARFLNDVADTDRWILEPQSW